MALMRLLSVKGIVFDVPVYPYTFIVGVASPESDKWQKTKVRDCYILKMFAES